MKRTIGRIVTAALILLWMGNGLFAEDVWTGFFPPLNINCIVTESMNVWAGTHGGLVKFDKLSGEREIYTTANSGLPSNVIKSIAVDQTGGLWIGSGWFAEMVGGEIGGLTHFDGENWTTCSVDSGGYPFYHVDAVTLDDSGNLWLGYHGGVVCYDGDNWTTFSGDSLGIPLHEIKSLAFSLEGALWAAGYFDLFRFNGSDWDVFDLSDLEIHGSGGIHTLAVDDSGHVWFSGTSFHPPLGLIKFDGNSFTIMDTSNTPLPTNNILSVTFDNAGTQWIGTSAGLVKVDSENWSIYDSTDTGLTSNLVTALAHDAQNHIWMGAGGDLNGLGDEEWTVCPIAETALPFGGVRSILEDCEDHIWVGMYDGRLARYDGFIWETFLPDCTSLFPGPITGLALDDDCSIWVGCEGGGLTVFDGSTWTNYDSLNSGLPSNQILSLVFDETGGQWVGTNTGLAHLASGGWTEYDQADLIMSGFYISEIVMDPQGRPWFTYSDGNSEGLAHLLSDTLILYDDDNSPLRWDIGGLATEGDGDLWVLDGGAVYKFDGDEWIDISAESELLESTGVTAITIDEQNVKWLGTGDCMGMGGCWGDGLLAFDDTGWAVFDEFNSPIPDNPISTLMVDTQGHIWVSIGWLFGGLLEYSGEPNIVGVDPNPSFQLNTPRAFSLDQNHPNPFNPSTTINYSLAIRSEVELSIYDITGRHVRTLIRATQDKGRYSLTWNGLDQYGIAVGTGVYFARLFTGGTSLTIKMLLLE